MPRRAASGEIEPRQVSVVVQGPIYDSEDLTRRVLESARRQLPGAEILLSTWAGAPTEGLPCDRVLLSADPGGLPHVHDPRFIHNTNRQIVTTRAGLQAASMPYAVKLRSEQLLTGRGFLKAFGDFPRRGDDLAIFEQRVVIPNVYTINPTRGRYLFHPSDWFTFGLTRDLLLLWDLPLTPEPESTHYFERRPEERRRGFPEMVRFPPEQYNWLTCLEKKYPPFCRHCQDIHPAAIRASELALVNNFIVLDLAQIGLAAPRHRLLRGAWSDCYTHAEFVRLYARHCDPGHHVPFDGARLKGAAIRGALRMRALLLKKPSGLGKPAADPN